MLRKQNRNAVFRLCLNMMLTILCASALGCDKNRHMVLASTGTNIGDEISQNPATQQPQAKLGYQRTELAIVPSNRSTENSATKDNSLGNGALDVPDVLMELRYGGIFDWGATSSIYQRLAVGQEAVRQPGASLMFSKILKERYPLITGNKMTSLDTFSDSKPTDEEMERLMTQLKTQGIQGLEECQKL